MSLAGLELHPVVEIAPEYFHGHPEFPLDERGEMYWQSILDWAGFRGIQAVSQYSWDVRLRSIGSDENLSILAAAVLGFREDPSRRGIEDLRELEALYGGLNLVLDGKIRIEPACCGRLRDVGNWIEAVRLPEGGAMELNIGDESMGVKRTSSGLELSGPPVGSSPLVLGLPALRGALNMAMDEIVAFGSRLVPVVRELLPDSDAIQITEHLIGRQDVGQKVW